MKITRCYQILEIIPESCEKEVKQAYKRLAKKWHPDKFVSNPALSKTAEENIKIVNQAYAQLITHLKQKNHTKSIEKKETLKKTDSPDIQKLIHQLASDIKIYLQDNLLLKCFRSLSEKTSDHKQKPEKQHNQNIKKNKCKKREDSFSSIIGEISSITEIKKIKGKKRKKTQSKRDPYIWLTARKPRGNSSRSNRIEAIERISPVRAIGKVSRKR